MDGRLKIGGEQSPRQVLVMEKFLLFAKHVTLINLVPLVARAS
jgi:hypothetical protein